MVRCLSLVAFSLLVVSASGVKFQIVNKCSFKIWPGLLGPPPIPENGGFELAPGASRDVQVPNGWRSNRVWARTGCDGNMNCETGFCGNKVQCTGAGGEPPVSLAEFTLATTAGEKDFYDVSYVDGYNIQVTVEPIAGTFSKNGSDPYSCTQAGRCSRDLKEVVPNELKQVKNGKTVAVYTACTKFRTDLYCCAGAHDKPETCKVSDWPVDYYTPMKKTCPTAYFYAYDDHTSTFTCIGAGGRTSPDYRIVFCGENSRGPPPASGPSPPAPPSSGGVFSEPCTETCTNGGHTPTCCRAHGFKDGKCNADRKAYCSK